jgi:serine/threonine protein kinase
MLKAIPSSTPHLQELQFQEFTNTRLVGPDAHIIPLLDQVTLSSCKVFLFEYQENGNLKSFLKNKKLTEDQALFIFKEILLAVIKVGDNGVVHRDIHARNVWIDKDFNFKLSGFERSLRIDDPRQINVKMNCLKLTHPDMRPPDLEEGLEIGKVDVWGLGCFLFYLLYRSTPFAEGANNNTSAFVLEILSACLQPDPAERPLPRKVLNMISNRGVPSWNQLVSDTDQPASASKYSAFHCVDNLINESTEPPDLFYLQQVSFDNWTRPSRVPDVFDRLGNRLQGISVCDLKVLIVIHRLMLSGPHEILCPALAQVLEKVLKMWTNNVKNQKDAYFCEFNNGLIRQVTRNLIEKVRFHMRTKTSCNWKSQILASDFQEIISYLAKVVRICEGLTMGMDILPQINSFLAMQLVEECQRLMMCIKPLDRNNDLQSFNSRLTSLSFEAPAPVKREKFSTGRIVLASPRSQRPNDMDLSSFKPGPSLSSSPKHSDLPSPPMIPSSNYPQLPNLIMPSPRSQVPDDTRFNPIEISEKFSKSAVNFSINSKETPPPVQSDLSDLIDLDFPIKVQVKKAEIQKSTPVKEEVSMNLLRNNSPVVSKVDVKSANIPKDLKVEALDPVPQRHIRNSSSGSRESRESVHHSDGAPGKRPALPAYPQARVGGNQIPITPVSLPAFAPRPVRQNREAKVLEIDKRWIIGKTDIKLGPVLGEGASCTVYKGEYKRTPVAVKIMMGTYAGQNIVQEFQREVTAMISLRHPNLVLFMGASVDPQMMIVSEFCRGESLFKLLHEKKQIHLSWSQKFKMILDIARGMLYLHEAQPPILHRDLKSLNLLLMDAVTGINDFILVKVTDFGIARILDEVTAKMTMQVGTCHWMAPEVINSEPYSLAADIYSFGIVLWEIAARETPYKGIMPIEIPVRVLKGERPDLNQIGPAVPGPIKDLIRHCWDQNPRSRPTFRRIIEELEQIQGQVDF